MSVKPENFSYTYIYDCFYIIDTYMHGIFFGNLHKKPVTVVTSREEDAVAVGNSVKENYFSLLPFG